MLQKRKKINKALITLMFLALLIIGTYFITNRYKKESIYKDNIKVIKCLGYGAIIIIIYVSDTRNQTGNASSLSCHNIPFEVEAEPANRQR